MTVLRDLWAMVGPGYITTTGVIALASQHDTVATSLGYPRPASVRAPTTWDNPRATSDDVGAWEDWYNSVAARAGLPPTSILEGNAATGTPWGTLRETARSRGVVTPVQNYFTVAADAWQTMVSSVQATVLPAMADNIRRVITEAERALQAWWFTRLGGASGTPQPFPRGDGPAMQPVAPPPGGTTPSNSGGTILGIDGDTVIKAAVAYLAFRALTKGRRGGRR